MSVVISEVLRTTRTQKRVSREGSSVPVISEAVVATACSFALPYLDVAPNQTVMENVKTLWTAARENWINVFSLIPDVF